MPSLLDRPIPPKLRLRLHRAHPAAASTPPPPPPAPLPPPPPPPPAPTHPLISKDNKSCPTLPLTSPPTSPPASPPQPSLLRRTSHPLDPLPLLNLSALNNPLDDLHAHRRLHHPFSTSLSHFRPYLYVSGHLPVRDITLLTRANITHIVNMGGRTCPNLFEHNFHYLRLCVNDDEREDLAPALHAVMAWIDDARRRNGVVVVHCRQGVSRSVTVALAYVMSREGVALDDAMRDMRTCRPIANPNAGFWRLLEAMEGEMRGGCARDVALAVGRVEGRVVPVRARSWRGVAQGEVVVLRRRRRGGVVVWVGTQVGAEARRMGAVVAEGILEQERVDWRRWGGHPPAKAAVRLVAQGDDVGVEDDIRAAMDGGV